jgi:hypothetical protein
MIKTILPLVLLGAFSFFSLQGMAQNTSIGLKASAGGASLGSDAPESLVPAFRLGGFLTYSVSSDFGVGAELNYARKGATPRGTNLATHLNYVEVPLLAHYFYGKKGFRTKFFAGPYFGYLLSAKRGEQELNNYEQQDYGFQAGVGLHKSLGKRRWLYADLRYSHGLTAVKANTEQANRDLSLHLGVSFPLEWGG